jgi:hypothetical protein
MTRTPANDQELLGHLAKLEAEHYKCPADVDAELALMAYHELVWEATPPDVRRFYERRMVALGRSLLDLEVALLPVLDRVRAAWFQRMAAAVLRRGVAWHAARAQARWPKLPGRSTPKLSHTPRTSGLARIADLSSAPGAPPSLALTDIKAVAAG